MPIPTRPVGLRQRIQNVTNLQSDQQVVIDLLSRIADSDGGKRDSWPAPPLAGPDGSVPKLVADAIWDFQVFWKAQGTFHNIDGVVDPDAHTVRQMMLLAGDRPPPTPPPDQPQVLHVIDRCASPGPGR